MKFWQVAALIGLGVLMGYFLWGRAGPPPPEVIPETKYIDTSRVDTVKWVPPILMAQLKALRGAIVAFLADTASNKPDTACVRLLAEAGITLDSLKRALSTPPGVRLSLADTLTFTWPVKALWVGVNYAAEGDSARIRWSNRQWPAPPSPKSKFGFGPGYGKQTGLGLAGQLRIADDKAIQGQVNQKGWEAYLLKFIK